MPLSIRSPSRWRSCPPRHRGFTLPELVVVLVVVAVLSVVALPKLDGALGFRDEAWRSELVAALRYGRQTATAARRLVCADISGNSVSLRIAPANPATACTTALPGPDGSTTFASSPGGSATTSASPTSTVYFQPSGRATRDGAGLQVDSWQISITGQTAITLLGETGHVE